MRIDFVEIANFRKLQSSRIEFNKQQTVLVGANNSGKTSAMVALRKFLISPKTIELRDISIDNWSEIDEIGRGWEAGSDDQKTLEDYLPQLDVWLYAPLSQIHHVVHIIPNADWAGGQIGVRLRYEIDNTANLKLAYLEARENAQKIENDAPNDHKPSVPPRSLVEFLEPSLSRYAVLRAYSLDPAQIAAPNSKGLAATQPLPEDPQLFEGDPFQGLINFREIPATREFSTTGNQSPSDKDSKSERVVRSLSDHVRSYFDDHINHGVEKSADDIEAYTALQNAEKAFDARLKTGFSEVFDELGDLGIPGINNPSIVINAKFKSLDGLSHGSAVQYRVSEPETDKEERFLPESYAGLGYQNLIAMVFLLMRFRQDWIEPKETGVEEINIAPLQLVLIEEPEAHLHAQVQQVFIKKAYSILRKHRDLGDSDALSTQLLVSTHSSHVSHEVDFENIRYFRRLPATGKGKSPTSTVINLSSIFGEDKDTFKFVKRYTKATDCDLFFADGAIFVEGQAERILVPYFIRNHFDELWRRYISLIDLGGANAPRLQPLIKALGLTSLVITDLDAGIPTKITDKNGIETTRTKKAKPELKCGQITTNPTLKSWHPCKESIDDLVALKTDEHGICVDDDYDLYVAYQKPVTNPANTDGVDVIPRTFEDALIFANFEPLANISGSATSNKIARLINSDIEGDDLESELFEIVDNAEKAAFAIDCLIEIEEGTPLVPPPYISSGLKWLQEQLEDSVTILSGEEENADG